MNCPESTTLNAYHDGELTPAEALLASEHVAECGECAAVIESLGTVGRVIADATPRPPATLWASIEAAAVAAAPAATAPWWTRVAAAAAGIILVLGTAALTVPGYESAPALAPMEPEQAADPVRSLLSRTHPRAVRRDGASTLLPTRPEEVVYARIVADGGRGR